MKKIQSALIASALLLAPAFAFAEEAKVTTDVQTSTGSLRVNAGARLDAGAGVKDARMNDFILKAKERAAQEIERRNEKLTEMSKRIDGMKRVTDADKASLKATLSGQVDAMMTLHARIDGENATTSLKEDIGSITKSYRIFALIMPQTAIRAAADRVTTIVTKMKELSTKLGERITKAQTAGVDVSALVTAHADYDAKIADAKVQADAAVAEVVNLKPDNGDKTVQASNLAALKDARSKIEAARKDLMTARKDADTIIKATREKKGDGRTTATTSAKVETE